MNETIEYQNIRGNRQYKSSLFTMVFSRKEDLLDLYNAINGTSYQEPEDSEINTLENAVYITIKNDVSFIVGCTMNLYEHQSSYNPNMPLRGMIYFAQMYNKYAEQRKLNLYSSSLQKIPTPQFIVFYNGTQEEPDRQVLRLSDAFQTDGGCIECEATMLNINYGKNRELMEKCKRLEDYAIFVATVRKYAKQEKLALGQAITLAIDECVANDVLADVLISQRAEVTMYILEAFDKEIYERDLKAEAIASGYAEGHAKGHAKGHAEGHAEGHAAGLVEGERKKMLELVKRKLAKGNSIREIADALEETEETIAQLIAELEA